MKAFIAAIALLIAPTHDGHNDEWLKALKNQNGHPCCDGSDAFRINDPDWKMENNKYYVKLRPGGQWLAVPEDRIVKQPNQVGYALVWPITVDGEDVVRCFLPGSTT